MSCSDLVSVFCIFSLVYIPCYLSKRQQNEEESGRKTDEETTFTGHVQVTLADDNITLQERNDTGRSKVGNKTQDETLSGSPVTSQITAAESAAVSAKGSSMACRGVDLLLCLSNNL